MQKRAFQYEQPAHTTDKNCFEFQLSKAGSDAHVNKLSKKSTMQGFINLMAY